MGAALAPCSTMLSSTASTTQARIRSNPGRLNYSSINSTNSIDASPRGPNQPSASFSAMGSPVPASDAQMGSMRTTVKKLNAGTRAGRSFFQPGGQTKAAPVRGRLAVSRRPPFRA